MKRILYLLVASLFLLVSCEQIDEDQRQEVNPNPVTTSGKAIVLEEFTGLHCINCPVAAEVAHNLAQAYPSIILVSLHGDLNTYTEPIGDTDFRIPEVKTYYDFFGPSLGLPTGMINRTKVDDSYMISANQWAAQIQSILEEEPTISIQTSLDESGDEPQVNITLQRLVAGTEHLNLVVELIESNIIGSQLQPDGSIKSDYIHNHVLRKVITDTWGEEISLSTPGVSVTKSYSFTIPEGSVKDNCAVVAYVAERDGSRSILQASEVSFSEALAVTGITLDQSALDLTVGQSQKLTATLLPAGASGQVVWTSSDETVASVLAGDVSALAVGEATITAQVGTYSASCVVNVTQAVGDEGAWTLTFEGEDGEEYTWHQDTTVILNTMTNDGGFSLFIMEGTIVNNDKVEQNYVVEVNRYYDLSYGRDEMCTSACMPSSGESTQDFTYDSPLASGQTFIYSTHLLPSKSITDAYIFKVDYVFYHQENLTDRRTLSVEYHYTPTVDGLRKR